MANKVNKVVSKKKTTTPKTPENPPVETVETVQVEETSTTLINPEVLKTPKATGLDMNHQVELLGLASKHLTGPTAAARYGEQTELAMDRIVAAGIVSMMADQAVSGEGTFANVLKTNAYPVLMSVAKEMGVTLPDIKALPAGPTADTVKLGSDQIKVSAEAKKQLKEEHKVEVAAAKGEIELDPKKVATMDEEALKDALKYILVSGPKQKRNVKDTLTSCVDFIREYRMAQADSANKPAEEKDKLDSRSVFDWLNDAFTYVAPTYLLAGIGKGMVMLTESEHCGVSAFTILRQSLTDKETGNVCWDDQSIADAVRAIVKWSCEDSIAKDKKNLETLDKKDAKYKDVSKKFEESIASFEQIINDVTSPNFDIINDLEELVKSEDATALKLAGRIRHMYYPETEKGVTSDYKNLYKNIAQYAGVIANLFCEPGSANSNYNESNITELVKYTDEEKAELKKEAVKAKEEESKNV